MAISEHNDKSLKQIPSSKQTKKVFGKPKTDPLERKMQEDKQVVSETARPKSWPNKIEVCLKLLKIYLYNLKIINNSIFHNLILNLFFKQFIIKILYLNNHIGKV